jgi:FkbM family methyltransferase
MHAKASRSLAQNVRGLTSTMTGGSVKELLKPIRNWVARASVGVARAAANDEQWGRITHELGAPSMLRGLLALRDRGVDLRGVIDGGACVGDWTRLLKRVYPQARVLMIEPQAAHQPALQALVARYAGTVELVHTLIGPGEQGDVPFYLLEDQAGGTGSSVLAEISDVPRRVVKLPMTTLDALARQRTWPVDLIKLDVQGFEIEVLKGASGLLKEVPYVLLEVSVWQYNEGGPLLHDALSWMRAAGFVSYDLFDISRRSDDVLMQLDLLFVRSDSPMLTTGRA